MTDSRPLPTELLLTATQAAAVCACYRACGRLPTIANVSVQFSNHTLVSESPWGDVWIRRGRDDERHTSQSAFAAAYGLPTDGLLPF